MPLTAVLAAVFGFVLLVAPGVVGWNVEEQLRAVHRPLAAYLGFPVEIETFERGWFGSVATVCAVAAPEEKLCARYDIQHGPLLRSGHWTLGWFGVAATPIVDEALQRRFASFVDDGDPGSLRVRGGLGGGISSELEVARLEGDVDGLHVVSQPLYAWFEYAPSSERVRSAIRYPGVEISGPQGKFTVAAFEGSSDGTHLGHGYLSGKGEVSLAKILLEISVDGSRVSATNLRWESDTLLDESGKYAATMTADVEALVLADPATPTQAGLTIGLAGIDFAKLIEVQQSVAAAPSPPDDAGAMLQILQEVLAQGMTFDLSRLDVRPSPRERLSAQAKVTLAPANDSGAPMLGLVQRLTGSGELRCSRVTLEKWVSPPMVQAWVTAGIATPDGDDLTAPLKLAEAKLQIGNQTLPLPLLLALLGQKVA